MVWASLPVQPSKGPPPTTYFGLAARSSVKSDSSQMSKFIALSHCTTEI